VIVEERDRLELSPSGKLSDVVSEIKESTSPRPEAVVPGSAAGAIPCDLPPPHPRPLSPEYGGEGRREAGPGAGDEVTGKTVLLGWELGAGLGHIRPLLHLARALAARGFRPVLAVKAPGDAKAQLRDCSFPVLQAPVPQPHPELASRPVIAASYADILALHGYGDVAMLSSMVQAWQGLIDQVKPDLVVCDHCPTLCLTAYGVLPTVIVGNGFFVPPADQASFPLLLPGQRLLVPEGQLLATIWEVQRRRQLPAPETLPGLLGRAERFVTVLPEMDPYQARRTQPAVGPLEPLPSPGELPPRGTFFAYLHAAAPHFEEVLAGLSGAGFLGKAYVLGITPAQRERFRRPQLEILEALPSLTDVLPHAAVVVHQGSAGLGQHALAVGRPQLLYPVHLEHVLNSQMLHRLGVGHYMTGQVSEIAVAGDLRLLMADRAMAQRALSVANAIHSSGPWDPLPRIVDRCVALLQRACPSSSST
jgi:hypothetical protein